MELDLEIPEYSLCLYEPKRYKVLHGGRGGGKSWAIAIALLAIGMNRPIRVLCARELQVSIQDSVHKLLSDVVNSNEGMAAFYDVQNKAIYGRNGTEFSFKGLKHNANEIKSYEGVDYCWVEEAQAVSDKSWEILIPTIRKQGSEIWICFNPKNPTDPTWQRFIMQADEDIIVKKVNWEDNPFFPDVLEKERLRLLKHDPEAYKHIWEGEFDTRYSGAVYAKWIATAQSKGKISPQVKHDPEYPVSTLWDLGYSDTTAIWFYQESPGEVLIIDYYENNSEGIGHYCDVLKEKPYRYQGHFVPQDAGKKLMEAAGRSIVEQAKNDHQTIMTVVPETTHANRHDGLRRTLPHCWFNSIACADGLQAIMAYHYEYDEERKIFKKQPVHDWSSHASTALELLPSVWRGRATTVKDLDKRALEAKFYAQRAEYNLDFKDPYQIKPKIKRRP